MQVADLSQRFPAADPLALDHLRQLLRFDPRRWADFLADMLLTSFIICMSILMFFLAGHGSCILHCTVTRRLGMHC